MFTFFFLKKKKLLHIHMFPRDVGRKQNFGSYSMAVGVKLKWYVEETKPLIWPRISFAPLFLLFYPWRLKREKWFFRRFLLSWMVQKVTEQTDEKGLFLQSCVRSDDLWRHSSMREKYFGFLSDFTLTWLGKSLILQMPLFQCVT